MPDPSSDAPDRDVLVPIVLSWKIIEDALLELGVNGPAPMWGDRPSPFKSKAEAGAKAILARLAANDPPIIVRFADDD